CRSLHFAHRSFLSAPESRQFELKAFDLQRASASVREFARIHSNSRERRKRMRQKLLETTTSSNPDFDISRSHWQAVVGSGGASLPSDHFSLNFWACRSLCKNRPIPLRGVRSRGTKEVRVHPTSRGRTRKIY